MFNYAPEQRIEFPSDSKSKLCTLGLATDFNFDRLEVSLEGACNFGNQNVIGWDRNVITNVNLRGVSTFVYSDVYTVNPGVTKPASDYTNNVVYDPSNAAQKSAVNKVNRATTSNGQEIGALGIYNSLSRFRPAYTNKYKGFMAVGDISYWLYKRDLKISYAAGVASGDLDPNENLQDPLASQVDGDYKGFIGLQQVYGGKSVKSAFLMGAGKINRPLTSKLLTDGFTTVADGFNNLIYSGFSLNYRQKWWEKSVSINPNILSYWEQKRTNKFDITLGKTTDQLAARYLGLEGNIMINIGLADDLAMEFVGAFFAPGQHYRDIQGTPFTATQRKILDASDPGDLPINLPILWSDSAYTFSLGLTYSF